MINRVDTDVGTLQQDRLYLRAFLLGSVVFSVLTGLVVLGFAAAYWPRRSAAGTGPPTDPAGGTGPEPVTFHIVSLPVSPLALTFGLALAWLLCVGLGYLWLVVRRQR